MPSGIPRRPRVLSHGRFYEMFFEDALTAARALELTLTSRSKDASGTAIPMCGVPFQCRRRLHRANGAM